MGKAALKVIDYAVFSRFSAHLGGKVRMIFVSSGGHVAPAHRKFLSIIFCTHISECYMRTETGIIAATSRSMYVAFPMFLNIVGCLCTSHQVCSLLLISKSYHYQKIIILERF